MTSETTQGGDGHEADTSGLVSDETVALRKIIGRNIARLRKARGLTQAQLGTALEVSRTSVCQWELGNVEQIEKKHLLSICAFFNVTQDELESDLVLTSAHLSGRSASSVLPAERASQRVIELLAYDLDTREDTVKLLKGTPSASKMLFNASIGIAQGLSSFNLEESEKLRAPLLYLIVAETSGSSFRRNAYMAATTSEFLNNGYYAMAFRGEVIICALRHKSLSQTLTASTTGGELQWDPTVPKLPAPHNEDAPRILAKCICRVPPLEML